MGLPPSGGVLVHVLVVVQAAVRDLLVEVRVLLLGFRQDVDDAVLVAVVDRDLFLLGGPSVGHALCERVHAKGAQEKD